MQRRFAYTLCLLVLAPLAGCSDDNGPNTSRDAPADVPRDTQADTPIDAAPFDVAGDAPVPDAAVTDAQPDADARWGDCATIGCGENVNFKVPGFLARFGAEARLIDITACRGTVCADARAEFLTNGGNNVTAGDGGPASVGATLPVGSDTLSVGFNSGVSPSAPMPRQEQVRLRITTSGGRLLVDFTTQVSIQVFCPGGLGCGICESVTVQLDSADGGQAVDANLPGGGGVCQ